MIWVFSRYQLFIPTKMVGMPKFISASLRGGRHIGTLAHWHIGTLAHWHIGTLKGSFRRAFMICSEGESFEKEIKHLKFVFTKINKYPTDVVEKTLREVREKIENTTQTRTVTNQRETNTVVDSIVSPHVTLPYIGKEGHKIVQGFKRYLRYLEIYNQILISRLKVKN